MCFSHRRENDEKSRRDSRLGLSTFCWKAHTHGSRQLFALASLGKPTFAVRRLCVAEKLAPAGARRAPCERHPVRCLRKGRRLTDHANEVSVDAVFHSRHRTIAGCTNGQAVRLQFF